MVYILAYKTRDYERKVTFDTEWSRYFLDSEKTHKTNYSLNCKLAFMVRNN